jgi:hypothetical protein
MKAKGKVILEKDKYFVQVGAQKHELVPNAFGGADTFKKLVGQDVEVVLSDPTLLAILSREVKPPSICFAHCFICYKPRPDFTHILEISEELRQGILQSFVNEGYIEQTVARKASGQMH